MARNAKGQLIAGPDPGRGRRGLAKIVDSILKKTSGGEELIDFALTMMRDEEMPPAVRLQAHGWLADRALGKPVQAIDLQARLANTGVETRFNLDKLSVEELRETLSALHKLQQTEELEGEVISEDHQLELQSTPTDSGPEEGEGDV